MHVNAGCFGSPIKGCLLRAWWRLGMRKLEVSGLSLSLAPRTPPPLGRPALHPHAPATVHSPCGKAPKFSEVRGLLQVTQSGTAVPAGRSHTSASTPAAGAWADLRPLPSRRGSQPASAARAGRPTRPRGIPRPAHCAGHLPSQARGFRSDLLSGGGYWLGTCPSSVPHNPSHGSSWSKPGETRSPRISSLLQWGETGWMGTELVAISVGSAPLPHSRRKSPQVCEQHP